MMTKIKKRNLICNLNLKSATAKTRGLNKYYSFNLSSLNNDVKNYYI